MGCTIIQQAFKESFFFCEKDGWMRQIKNKIINNFFFIEFCLIILSALLLRRF